MEDSKLYRIRDVAAYLSLSRSKVYELVRTGQMASIKIDGARRVRGRDVFAFIDAHAVSA